MAPKTEAEARELARRLLEEAEFRRQEAEAEGEIFESLDEETLVKKIMGDATDSPFFSQQNRPSGPPGGTAAYKVFIHNPDPTGYPSIDLYSYVFFGPSNFIQDLDTALTMVDTRFPRYFQRMGVAAGANAGAEFTINIPSGITPGIYMGNCFLVLRGAFDVGNIFDRAAFPLTVKLLPFA